MQTPKGWVASFGTEVLKMLAGQKTYILKGSASGIEEISVRGIPPTKLDKYGRQWIHWVDTEQTTLQEMNVEGKFVFVGVTAWCYATNCNAIRLIRATQDTSCLV
jgi:hypothetical protein